MKRYQGKKAVVIGGAALFLAFEATFTTGIELTVDGGLAYIGAPL